jgi:putative sigma-54 modulation protein
MPDGAKNVIVTISSRHMQLTPALKQHAEERAEKLTKYYDRIQEIEVIIESAEKTEHRVEMIVNGEKRRLFIAEVRSNDAYAGIDACAAKLERQLTDHHKLVKNRKHQ